MVMPGAPDDLIEQLLYEVAFAGTRGLGYDGLQTAIKTFYENTGEQIERVLESDEAQSATSRNKEFDRDDRVVQLVWQKLQQHPEIQVQEVNIAESPTAAGRDGNVMRLAPLPTETEIPENTTHRLRASEDRIWRAITGHRKDTARVPQKLFDCLEVIAAGGREGVLQPDVTRLTGQDKRSVPKRTDYLAERKYIVKDTVIALKTKTSRLRHWRFAQSVSGNEPSTAQAYAKISSHTEDVILYGDWFDSIIRLLHENDGIIAVVDLHAGLDIPPQDKRMRALTRCLRRLCDVGCIRRVKARADVNPHTRKPETWLRCIQLLREPTDADRTAFKTKPNPNRGLKRKANLDQGMNKCGSESEPASDSDASSARDSDEDDEMQDAGQHASSQWAPDSTHLNLIFDSIDETGIRGITFQELKAKLSRSFWLRSFDQILMRLADNQSVSRDPHLDRFRLVGEVDSSDDQRLVRYRSYANFHSAVEAGKTTWEAALGNIKTMTAESAQSAAGRVADQGNRLACHPAAIAALKEPKELSRRNCTRNGHNDDVHIDNSASQSMRSVDSRDRTQTKGRPQSQKPLERVKRLKLEKDVMRKPGRPRASMVMAFQSDKLRALPWFKEQSMADGGRAPRTTSCVPKIAQAPKKRGRPSKAMLAERARLLNQSAEHGANACSDRTETDNQSQDAEVSADIPKALDSNSTPLINALEGGTDSCQSDRPLQVQTSDHATSLLVKQPQNTSFVLSMNDERHSRDQPDISFPTSSHPAVHVPRIQESQMRGGAVSGYEGRLHQEGPMSTESQFEHTGATIPPLDPAKMNPALRNGVRWSRPANRVDESQAHSGSSAAEERDPGMKVDLASDQVEHEKSQDTNRSASSVPKMPKRYDHGFPPIPGLSVKRTALGLKSANEQARSRTIDGQQQALTPSGNIKRKVPASADNDSGAALPDAEEEDVEPYEQQVALQHKFQIQNYAHDHTAVHDRAPGGSRPRRTLTVGRTPKVTTARISQKDGAGSISAFPARSHHDALSGVEPLSRAAATTSTERSLPSPSRDDVPFQKFSQVMYGALGKSAPESKRAESGSSLGTSPASHADRRKRPYTHQPSSVVFITENRGNPSGTTGEKRPPKSKPDIQQLDLDPARVQNTEVRDQESNSNTTLERSRNKVYLSSSQVPINANDLDRLYRAIALLKTLCNGIHQDRIPWNIVCDALGPGAPSADALKGQWQRLNSEGFGDFTVKTLQRRLHEPFLTAYADGTLPLIDFQHLESTDWSAVLLWMESAVLETDKDRSRDPLDVPLLPALAKQLQCNYDLFDPSIDIVLDSGESLHNATLRDAAEANGPLSSSLRRATRYNKGRCLESVEQQAMLIRSWVRANAATRSEEYDAAHAARKMGIFSAMQLQTTVEDLEALGILQPVKRNRQLPGRNFFIPESVFESFQRWPGGPEAQPLFLHAVAASRTKFVHYFANHDQLEMSVETDTPDMLVLTNLVGQGLLRAVSVLPKRNDDFDAPFPKLTAWGYSGLKHDTRQIDRAIFNFPVLYQKTPRFTSEHALNIGVPIPVDPNTVQSGPEGCIPFWVDINGCIIFDVWQIILAAILWPLVYTPGITVFGIEEIYERKLWVWEIRMAMTWMEEVGIAVKFGAGAVGEDRLWDGGWRATEWWYCAFIPGVCGLDASAAAHAPSTTHD